MAREWRKIVIEEDPGVIEVFSNGRMMQGLNVGMCDEDVEAIRTGYKCITCWENLDEAFPKECPVCGFPCRDRQAEQFVRVYKGYEPGLRTGPDWEAAADRIEEQQERRAFQQRAAKSGISLGLKGISIPKALKR